MRSIHVSEKWIKHLHALLCPLFSWSTSYKQRARPGLFSSQVTQLTSSAQHVAKQQQRLTNLALEFMCRYRH